MNTTDEPEARSSDERARLSREAITDAARELVDEQGLNRLTMRALGDKLGVQAMSLYHYFDNKQELIEAISVQAASATAQFGAFFESTSAMGAPPQEIVVALGLRYIQFAEEYPDQFYLAFNTLPVPFATWDEFVSAPTNFSIPQSAVQAGIDAGVFVERDGYGRDEMAFSFWALVHGLAVLRLTRLRDVEADFEALHRSALEALVRQFQGE